MKQTEIIAQLRDLRESQADFAKTNGDEIFARDVEALDAAIAILGRIRWRKVGDELPDVRSGQDLMQVAVSNKNPDLKYIRYGGYYRGMRNPWCNSPGMRTVLWAYPPELPEVTKCSTK